MAQILVTTVANSVFYCESSFKTARSLATIKAEISARIFSKEYLPEFIERNEDLQDLCNAIGEFWAPFEKQLEDFEDIWNNYSLLKKYLEQKHMIFNGTETIFDLHTIAETRLQIIADRGTMNMQTEIKRICADEGGGSQTSISFKDFGECGWVAGKVSPCYRTGSTAISTGYIGIRELVIFNLHNHNTFFNNDSLKELLEKYFVPKHISYAYNFIT